MMDSRPPTSNNHTESIVVYAEDLCHTGEFDLYIVGVNYLVGDRFCNSMSAPVLGGGL